MATWQPPAGFKERPVAVLGGGVLGRRIAACWYAAGYKVIVRDPSETSRRDALAYIKESLGTYSALTGHEPGKIEVTEDLVAAVKDCWMVFECVPEKLEIKQSTLADLEKYTREDCILGSNSSSYKSGDLIGLLKESTKTRVLNTHYMMPPEALVVELMTDGHTPADLIKFVSDQHQDAGLHPIVAHKQSSGFVFNRIWAALKRETLKVLAEGICAPADIDRVFKELYGARDGPCHMMDQVGLDTVEHIEEHYIEERHLTRYHVDWLHQNYTTQGKLGNKSEKGGLYDKPKPGSQTKLYFLNLGVAERLDAKLSMERVLHRGQLLSLNVDEGGKPTELVSKVYMPDGIAISQQTQRIFWTDMGNPEANDGSVHSVSLDGSDEQVVVPPGGAHTPKQCVIDEDSQKLYFCDREGCRVMRVNLDGTGLETIFQIADFHVDGEKAKDQRNWCVGIAVSAKLGKVFWTQKGYPKANQGRIFSAGLEIPKDAKVTARPDVELLMSNLPEPIDLELNDEGTVLFWTDRGELPLGNTLNRKTLVGGVPDAERVLGRQIIAQGLGEGIGLVFDAQKHVIWVADLAGRIWKCDPDRPGQKQKVYESSTSALTGLAVLHV